MQTGDPTGDSLYYPVVQGLKPLKALPSLADVKTQTIDPYTWGLARADDQQLVRREHRAVTSAGSCPRQAPTQAHRARPSTGRALSARSHRSAGVLDSSSRRAVAPGPVSGLLALCSGS